MSAASGILYQTIIKPFYRENAGVFVFAGTMMFFIVNKVDGAGLFEYHYSLIIGTLSSGAMLALVLGVWLLYAGKCTAFFAITIRKPELHFLQAFNAVPAVKRLLLLLFVQICFLLPILLYAFAIIWIGLKEQYYAPVLQITIFLLAISVGATVRHKALLHTAPNTSLAVRRTPRKQRHRYHSFLLRFLLDRQKRLWWGLQLFTCGLLYLIARNNTTSDYDHKPAFLFYSFCILAHGMLVHRLHEFEATALSFYRSLPVPLWQRLGQYGLLYAWMLVPTITTLVLLAPGYLHLSDVLGFGLIGYASMLLLHSFTLVPGEGKKDFMVLGALLFVVQYILMLTTGLILGGLLLLGASALLFRANYYRFEPTA